MHKLIIGIGGTGAGILSLMHARWPAEWEVNMLRSPYMDTLRYYDTFSTPRDTTADFARNNGRSQNNYPPPEQHDLAACEIELIEKARHDIGQFMEMLDTSMIATPSPRDRRHPHYFCESAYAPPRSGRYADLWHKKMELIGMMRYFCGREITLGRDSLEISQSWHILFVILAFSEVIASFMVPHSLLRGVWEVFHMSLELAVILGTLIVFSAGAVGNGFFSGFMKMGLGAPLTIPANVTVHSPALSLAVYVVATYIIGALLPFFRHASDPDHLYLHGRNRENGRASQIERKGSSGIRGRLEGRTLNYAPVSAYQWQSSACVPTDASINCGEIYYRKYTNMTSRALRLIKWYSNRFVILIHRDGAHSLAPKADAIFWALKRSIYSSVEVLCFSLTESRWRTNSNNLELSGACAKTMARSGSICGGRSV